jgi:hypothetical protein
VLDPDVVFRIDGGPKAAGPLARPPLIGAEAVASEAILFRGGAGRSEPVIVNGQPGLMVRLRYRPPLVAAFTVVEGRIAAIDVIADPDKLHGLVLDD